MFTPQSASSAVRARRQHACTWPSATQRSRPNPRDATALAAQIRGALLPQSRVKDPLADFRRIARAGRFEISQERLSAAEGQEEALLIPLDDDRFAICVDPTPRGGWARIKPSIRAELRRHRHRFRVAHEIAHTFFYDREGGKPRRLFVGSPQEEDFCDEFARSLLVPADAVRLRSPSVSSLLALHRDYDVSVEVAARALAGAYPSCKVALWYEHSRDGWLLQWSNVPPKRVARLRDQADVCTERGQAIAVC